MQVLSISDLAEHVTEAISDQPMLQDVWVEGEVAEVNVSMQGHCYMTLKDDKASLRTVMFRLSYTRLRFQVQVGMVLLAHGKVSFYRERSQVQLVLDNAQPSGTGALALAFDQLRLKLEREGLFDARAKRKPPFFPRRVAVVTSESGAALRDVLKVLRRRCPIVPALLVHAPVQGEVAAAALVRALRRAASRPGVDVVLLVRGGGSIEDLMSFNDEALARAIRATPVPVIVGVGHETDFTIADFAADVRAATPSQAAELAVPNLVELRRGLVEARRRLSAAVGRETEAKRERLTAAAQKLTRLSPDRQLPALRQRLDDRLERLSNALRVALERGARQVEANRQRLEALSPLRVLARGYSLARDDSGALVTSVAALRPGVRLTTVFADGSALAEVLSVHPAEAG